MTTERDSREALDIDCRSVFERFPDAILVHDTETEAVVDANAAAVAGRPATRAGLTERLLGTTLAARLRWPALARRPFSRWRELEGRQYDDTAFDLRSVDRKTLSQSDVPFTQVTIADDGPGVPDDLKKGFSAKPSTT